MLWSYGKESKNYSTTRNMFFHNKNQLRTFFSWKIPYSCVSLTLTLNWNWNTLWGRWHLFWNEISNFNSINLNNNKKVNKMWYQHVEINFACMNEASRDCSEVVNWKSRNKLRILLTLLTLMRKTLKMTKMSLEKWQIITITDNKWE